MKKSQNSVSEKDSDLYPLAGSGTSKSDFISIATHQLKTPLAGNKWAVSFLLGGNVGPLTASQRELLEKVYDGNERAIRLIDDMLRADREESQIFTLDPVKVNIQELIEKIIQELSPSALKKDITLGFTRIRDVIPPVFADHEKMNYVFENLLDNAIRYTRDGGSVKVNIDHEDGVVIVSITDTGVGIPKNDQTNIFKKFFRAINARKTQGVGTGLGLYITKKIVEEHSGSIWFESVEGKGTTFWVALPIADGVE